MDHINAQLSQLSIPDSTQTLPSIPLTPVSTNTRQAHIIDRRAQNALSLRLSVYVAYKTSRSMCEIKYRHFCRTCYRPLFTILKE